MEMSQGGQNSSYTRNTLRYRIDRFAEQTGAERQGHERPYARPPTLTKQSY